MDGPLTSERIGEGEMRHHPGFAWAEVKAIAGIDRGRFGC